MTATTTNYSFPYPELTDTPNGATQIQSLATAVDTALNNTTLKLTQLTADTSAISSTTLVATHTITLPSTGTFFFDSEFLMTNTGSAGRPGFALGGTATPTAWRWAAHVTGFNNAAASGGNTLAGTSFPGSTSGSALIAVDWSTTGGFSAVRISGTFTVSVVGTITFRFSESSGSGSVFVKAGSWASVQRYA
jgi:hypothetical protein